MRWTDHVARVEDRRSLYKVLVVNMREREQLEDPSIDGWMILRQPQVVRWEGHILD
jgi:hypothetical protein